MRGSVLSGYNDRAVNALPHAQKRFRNTFRNLSDIGHIPRKFIFGLVQKRKDRLIDRIVDLIKTLGLCTAEFRILLI